LLRPDRFRVFCPQVPRRGRRQVDKGERAPARHRVPAGRGPRHRPAQRRRLCRSRLVGAHILRKLGESCLRRHRPGGARHRARIQAGLRGSYRQECPASPDESASYETLVRLLRDAAVANRKERRVKKILTLTGRKPTLAGSDEGQSQQTIMSIRPSLRDYACTAVALLAVLSGRGTAFSQQENNIDIWMAAPSDLTLAVTEVPPVLTVTQVAPTDSALTSTEQGQTPLDESFEFRQWRLERRRQALKDTKFEFNLRTFYLDRSDFSGAEKQAWAIGGWLGVKTGYFLDHIAFGATVYTSNPIYAPDDRDGTTLLAPGQNGYTILGEFYAELRIVKDVGITVGAKGYDTPFINRNDTRMTPNTFEAVVLQGRYEFGDSSSGADVNSDGIGLSKDGKEVAVPTPTPAQDVSAIKYGLGYFDKIKERNDSEF